MNKEQIKEKLNKCYQDRELIISIINTTGSTRHKVVILPQLENKILELEKMLSSLP